MSSKAKVFRASFSLQNAKPVLKTNISVHSSDAMSNKIRNNFLKSMEAVYGKFSAINRIEEAKEWTPPPALDGHRGRYLWTDAFGVLNFLTLFKETQEDRYLIFAQRLISTVHDILGRSRDGTSRLPNATDEHPLRGGLRIGKNSESGRDGDGQYHHYLTIWMFALNRTSIAANDRSYNDLAIQLAKAIHPHFVYNRETERPRMYWKMSMDLSHNLVTSEGGLDPIDGFVIFSLLQKTSGDNSVLADEISDYFKIVKLKYARHSTDDPLDLGMSLWTCHFFKDEMPWAAVMTDRLMSDLSMLNTVIARIPSLMATQKSYWTRGSSPSPSHIVSPSASSVCVWECSAIRI